MPKPWFERDADRLGDADIEHIVVLAQTYQTSLEATANRYVDLVSAPCAIVMSNGGTIRYARPHGSFPALSVRAGDRLPSECATALKHPSTVRTSQEWLEIDGAVWLKHDWGRRAPGVLEQVYVQRNGYMLTMLTLSEPYRDDQDDEENEADVSDRWRPRFG